MKYYKYVDIDYLSVLGQIQSYVKDHRHLINDFWVNMDRNSIFQAVPELPKIFEPLNLTIVKLSFVTLLEKESQIHIDDNPASVRINIPIFNCNDSETRFFKYSGEHEKRYLSNGVAYIYLDPEKCEHVDTLVLNKPAALRGTEPHQVIAGSKLPRVSLTIRFKESIEHLLED